VDPPELPEDPVLDDVDPLDVPLEVVEVEVVEVVVFPDVCELNGKKEQMRLLAHLTLGVLKLLLPVLPTVLVSSTAHRFNF